MAKKKDEAAPAETDSAPAEKITQRVAVERALAAGKELPPDGVQFVKDTFGMELTKSNFSTIKSQLKKASGSAPTKPGRKPGRPAASSNGAAAAAGGSSSSGKAPNPADLARGVKLLVSQYGAEAVKSMAEVFAE